MYTIYTARRTHTTHTHILLVWNDDGNHHIFRGEKYATKRERDYFFFFFRKRQREMNISMNHNEMNGSMSMRSISIESVFAVFICLVRICYTFYIYTRREAMRKIEEPRLYSAYMLCTIVREPFAVPKNYCISLLSVRYAKHKTFWRAFIVLSIKCSLCFC